MAPAPIATPSSDPQTGEWAAESPQGPLPQAGVAGALEQRAIERLLDANLDRAREGLRVIEDWCRFGLERPDLVSRTKDFRQRLGRCHPARYKLARHTATDPAAGMAHGAQAERLGAAAVVAANCGRVQEALRVLEEFGRSEAGPLAAEAAAIRYGLYDLEVDVLRAAAGPGWRRELLQHCQLYLVTSPAPNLEAVVAAALEAGVRLVQYRAKADPPLGGGPAITDQQRLSEARALRQLCAQVRSGKLKAFAVSSATRSVMAPELPTAREAGVPGYDATFGEIVLAPKGTPPAILRAWQEELAKAFQDPAVRERMLAIDLPPVANTPADALSRVRSESLRWAKVVDQVKLQVD